MQYINGYICRCLALFFISGCIRLPEYHILQFHASWFIMVLVGLGGHPKSNISMRLLHLFMLILLSTVLFVNCNESKSIIENKNSLDKDWTYAYSENYVDSLDAIFCHQGYTALFGFKKIEAYPNTQERLRVIYVIKTNFENGDVDLNDATIFVVDSIYFPIQIANKKTNIILSRTDDNHFDYAFYNSNKKLF